jgi:hypothetical protein
MTALGRRRETLRADFISLAAAMLRPAGLDLLEIGGTHLTSFASARRDKTGVRK